MVAILLQLGLRAKDLWGRDIEVFMNLRKYFQKEYGLEFANKYFCCTENLQFNLHRLQAHEFFTWADPKDWGSRLAGGLSFAINFELKKFMLFSNYSSDIYCKKTYDDDHHYIDRNLSIHEGFERIFDIFIKEYEIDEDYRMYICQEGMSFYYDRNKEIEREKDESLRDYRLRTYRIYKVGTKRRPFRDEMKTVFIDDYTIKK